MYMCVWVYVHVYVSVCMCACVCVRVRACRYLSSLLQAVGFPRMMSIVMSVCALNVELSFQCHLMDFHDAVHCLISSDCYGWSPLTFYLHASDLFHRLRDWCGNPGEMCFVFHLVSSWISAEPHQSGDLSLFLPPILPSPIFLLSLSI